MAELAGAIEEEEFVDDQQRPPFSPSALASQLTRLGAEARHQQERRDELLSPEAQAVIPHYT